MAGVLVPSEVLLPSPAPRAFELHRRTGLSLPVHHWLSAGAWAGGIMLLVSLVYAVEKYLLDFKGTPQRMIHDPAEFSIRFFGLAHYAVATYLLFSSAKMRSLRGVLTLGLFTLLSAATCGGFYLAGGAQNKLAVIVVFLFFLVHALRDEVFFYRMRVGSAVKADEFPHVYRMSLWLQVAGLMLLAGLLYPLYTWKYFDSPIRGVEIRQLYEFLPASWSFGTKIVFFTAPFPLAAVAALVYVQRNHPRGLLDFLRSHGPLTVIVGGTFLIAASSAAAGSWLLDLVVLTHFTGWFLFALEGIRKQPPAVRRAITWRQPNSWIRRNAVGFWVFHGGLAAGFLLILVVNHWILGEGPVRVAGWEIGNPCTTLFGRNSLYYWTLTHLVLGFTPKG